VETILAFALTEFLGQAIWVWFAFLLAVGALLVFDLGVAHRGATTIGVRQSLQFSAFYIIVGLSFTTVIWVLYGGTAGAVSPDPQLSGLAGPECAWMAVQLYLTGFAIEKTLALDNIFVIALVFSALGIPAIYQHRVLFWGILGVIVLRALLIGVGAVLVSKFAWLLYVFGLVLIATAIIMLRKGGKPFDASQSPIMQWLRRRLRVTDALEEGRFLVRKPDPSTGRLHLFATPLLLALLFIELVDLVFAIDSVPAIFAITSDPYIIYTSNIFAILGLRALFFALAAMSHRFQYLKYALALTLAFIGSKIFIGDLFFASGKFPAAWSLAITLGLIASGILYSIWRTRTNAACRVL
jgi:tellurite resistance protein TerC